LDLSGISNVEEMVLNIRQEIFENCGCKVSAGIGPNILIARLACRFVFFLDL
jgi:nucleotidyltransferase/DNA polymerase involved in DNA repair